MSLIVSVFVRACLCMFVCVIEFARADYDVYKWVCLHFFFSFSSFFIVFKGTILTIPQVEAQPISLNTQLGYYTNFVNPLDMCAVQVSYY